MEEIANVAIGYFDNLFCAGNCDQMEECLNVVPRKVTPEMHDTLSSEFSVVEVKMALFQMGLTKAPRPDGMNAFILPKILACCG